MQENAIVLLCLTVQSPEGEFIFIILLCWIIFTFYSALLFSFFFPLEAQLHAASENILFAESLIEFLKGEIEKWREKTYLFHYNSPKKVKHFFFQESFS